MTRSVIYLLNGYFLCKKGGERMNETEKEVAIAELKKEIGSIKHRLDDVEKIVDAVHGLAQQMGEQTIEIRHMNEIIKNLNEDVAKLKEKPAARWESLVGTVIGAIGGAAAALFLK